MHTDRKTRRQTLLLKLLNEKFGSKQTDLAAVIGIQDSLLSRYLKGTKGMGEAMVERIEATTGLTDWFNQPISDPHQGTEAHEFPRPSTPKSITIPQYETGGAMGHGFVLSDEPPGIIRSWSVSPDWLRLNVPVHTGIHNLCIVTGFGPSMKPRYNPGDPLLCDLGVTKVKADGVYFFRVDGHGFIKQLQRMPTAAGMVLRARSFNPDYEPFDITQDMDFQVIGSILTAWRSEQF